MGNRTEESEACEIETFAAVAHDGDIGLEEGLGKEKSEGCIYWAMTENVVKRPLC